MLTMTTGSRIGKRGKTSRNCDGISRRDAITAGGLLLGGLTLPGLLRAGSNGGSYLKDRSIVLLYLSGGASQIETFDPKPTGPAGARSLTGDVATKTPGVSFGGTFPQLAALSDKLSVVRSFHHSVGDHVRAHVHMLTGGIDAAGAGETGHSIGSLVAKLRGATTPGGLPQFQLLTEEEIDNQYNRERGRIRLGSKPGSLGLSFAPFEHEIGWREKPESDRRRSRKDENPLAANMRLNMESARFDDRLALLSQLDRIERKLDSGGMMKGVDRFNSQAVNLVLGGAAEAFDWDREDRRTIERYDTSHMRIGFKTFRPSTLGKQMLVARRLAERGCGFVTVHSAGWDMHADNNNPNVATGMEMLGRSLDRAVSAFIEDVHARGLNDKILLVVAGDFGRTPRVNKNGGRDHWARLCPLLLSGGGLRMGEVIGRSTRDAGEPDSTPVTTSHLLATLMHSQFDLSTLRLDSGVPREINTRLQAIEPIPGLI